MNIGYKINKPIQDYKEYAKVAKWCNSNNAIIEDNGDNYEVVEIPVVEKALEEAKAEKLTEINTACDSILNAAISSYPETEVLTFDQQTSEATKYLQTKKPEDAPLLSALALGRGITLDDLVQRVIAKHTAFSMLSGYIIGQRQALEDRLDECGTVEDVEAIVVDIKLSDTSQNEEEVTEG